MILRSHRIRLIIQELLPVPWKKQKRALRKRHPDTLYRSLRIRLRSRKINTICNET